MNAITSLEVKTILREDCRPPYMSIWIGEKCVAHLRKMEPVAPSGILQWWWDDRREGKWIAAGLTQEKAVTFVLKELGFTRQ